MSNTLSWNDVNYVVRKEGYTVSWAPFKVQKERSVRTILNNVSGQIRTGDMVAIIGSSGAGKTSLMACLCNRIRGKISGQFFVNDLPAKKNLISSVTGFVPQFETAFEVLTVQEHLYFVATLKLGRHLLEWEKQERVESVIKRLGLSNQRMTRIKHLSGGERKKLNLAEELIREPLFLFCDEPTTGLDSYNSKSVMQSLKRLTGNEKDDEANKRAVICSIHQPSSEVFSYFTSIILMDAGSIVYHGKISECYGNLEKINLTLPPNYNPAEFFVNLVSPIPFKGLDHDERIFQISQVHKITTQLKSIKNSDEPKLSATDIEEVESLPWIMQFLVLFQRASMVGCRDLGQAAIHCSSHLIISLGVAILYAGKSANQQVMVSDAEGLFFNVIAEVYFFTYMNVVDTMVPDMPLIRKESGENLYATSSFYIMKFLSLLPKMVLECIITSSLAYYLSSFTRDFDTFAWITVSYVLLGVTATSYGMMWAGLYAAGFGMESSSPFDLFQMLASGIYGAGTLPMFLRYISTFFLFTEAISYQYWASVETIDCVPDIPCWQNGMEVLERYSYGQSENTVLIDYGIAMVLCVAFNVIGFFSLKRAIHKEGFY